MDDEVNLFEYYITIAKRKKLFLSIFITVCIIGIIVTLTSKKTYRSEASFFFPYSSAAGSFGKNLMKSLGGESDAFSLLNIGSASSMEEYAISILKSRTITDNILDKYGKQIFKDKFEKKSRTQLRQSLSGYVKIELSKEGIIEITVTTEDPKLSADIANSYIEEYKKFSDSSILSYSKQNLKFFTEQEETSRKTLEKWEELLRNYQETHKVIDVPEEAKNLIKYQAEIKTMEVQVSANYANVQQELDSLRIKLTQQAQKSNKTLEYPAFSTDQTLNAYYNELSAKQIELLRKKETQTGDHPEIIALNQDIENVKEKIRNHISTRLESIKSNLTPELIENESKALGFKASKEAVEAFNRQLEKQLEKIPELNMDYGRYYRNVKVNSQIHIYWTMELQKATAEIERDPTNYQILDKAVPPDFKYRPLLRLNAAITLILASIMSLGAVFTLEAFETQKSRYMAKFDRTNQINSR